jgi:hypothetical protein
VSGAAGTSGRPQVALPADIAAEIKTVDEMRQSIRANEPIAQWRFETVRSRYQAILQGAGPGSPAEEAIRMRLAAVTRDEQAARAARTIDTILADSHRRDREVALARRRVAAALRSRAKAYSAVGYVQPSARLIEGRKLYVLIGNDGSTVAYLDIPPGLDIDHLLARRVGVRGEPHFDEELGARLITVRDVESTPAKR